MLSGRSAWPWTSPMPRLASVSPATSKPVSLISSTRLIAAADLDDLADQRATVGDDRIVDVMPASVPLSMLMTRSWASFAG